MPRHTHAQMTTPSEGSTALRSLGLLVRQYRVAQGLTQEELAERAGLGISVETISNLERGKTRPYRATLDAVVSALQLSEDDAKAVVSAWRPAGGSTQGNALERGRAATARRSWPEAFDFLSQANKD